MAYMSQDRKKSLSPAIKSVLKQYGIKGTIAVRHHSTLVVNIKSGLIDFGKCVKDPVRDEIKGHYRVNPYCIEDHYKGLAASFLLDLKAAMMDGNHDNSDIMTDYFDVGWYIDINIGDYNKPYICTQDKDTLERIKEVMNA